MWLTSCDTWQPTVGSSAGTGRRFALGQGVGSRTLTLSLRTDAPQTLSVFGAGFRRVREPAFTHAPAPPHLGQALPRRQVVQARVVEQRRRRQLAQRQEGQLHHRTALVHLPQPQLSDQAHDAG